ncbi:MAG: hypothetical protein HYV16_14890 [Gammaproteobacteria bacterium]|nr:hypothetical protein [Gammaproteobacteria bacterium]
MKTTRILLGISALALQLGTAQAAKLVPPPLSFLVSGNEGHNQIAIAVAEAHEGPSRIRFKASQVLLGAPFQSESIKLDPVALDGIKPGESYLVVFSQFRRNPVLRGVSEVNPEGAVARGFPEVKSAVFRQGPAIQTLFVQEIAKEADPGKRLQATLAALATDDETARILAAEELLLRPALLGSLDEPQFARLQTLAGEKSHSFLVRDLLWQACLQLPEARRGAWLAELGREFIATQGHRYDLASRQPSTMISAIKFLGAHVQAADRERLRQLVYSNAPGVAKAALAALDQLDREATRQWLAGLPADADIHKETRSAMASYLKPRLL